MIDRPLQVMFPASLTPGGAERQMLLLVKYLPRARFEVSFVLLGDVTDLALEAQRLGATIHALGAPRRAGMPAPLFAARVARRVARYVELCRTYRYDIVDAWLYHGYGLAAVTRPASRVPTLIAGRRSLSAFKARFGPVERAVDVVARRSADLIVANSEAVKADVAEREGVDPARIRVIRNGVELPPLASSQDRVVLRETWSIPPDALVIGSVGTFKLGKGQAAVVRTVADIRARLPGAWLVLVGDGPERIAVEALAKSFGLTNVRFVGAVADARSLYHGFDVLASASEAEGMPNVILEACAASVPVVATDAGGTREVVLDGRTGRLVPIGDTRALGQALLDVLGDPILTRRLGAAARDHVAQRFGIDRFVSETAAMYEEMANRHVARS